MRRRSWAIVIAETHDSAFIEEFDPLNRAVQPHADVDFEPWVPHVCFVPLWTPLEGVLVVLEVFFKAIDVLLECSLLSVVVILPSSDHNA